MLRDLSLLSKTLYQDLAANGDLEFEWQERGLLMLYKTASAEHEMAEEADVANRAGIEAKVLDGQQVQELEPNTRVDVRGGILFPRRRSFESGRIDTFIAVFFTKERRYNSGRSYSNRFREVRLPRYSRTDVTGRLSCR